MDRCDYVGAILNGHGVVGAIEKLAGIEIPKKAQYIRVILAEWQRVASHLLWLGTHALDIGAMGVFFYGLRDREPIMDLFESMVGQRLLPNAFPIGGVRLDFPKGWERACRDHLKIMHSRIDEYEGLLTGNRIWKQRTQKVGVLDAKDCLALGITGPPLRSAGVSFDVRKSIPYSAYPDFDFMIPTGNQGDVFDRYKVRIQEMRQSLRIIQQAMDGIPQGPLRTRVSRLFKPPVGEVYHTVEGAKGQLGFYLVSDGTDQPWRLHIRGPSFVNLQGLDAMCRNQLIADVVAVIGSLDVVLGEVDR